MKEKFIDSIVSSHMCVRWRGDYGGKRQQWFPSNYVEEMEEETTDSQPLGDLQKGTFDLTGVTVGKFYIQLPEVLILGAVESSEQSFLLVMSWFKGNKNPNFTNFLYYPLSGFANVYWNFAWWDFCEGQS